MDGNLAGAMAVGRCNRDRLRRATRDAHMTAEHLWFSAGAFADRATFLQWLSVMADVHASIGQPAAMALRAHISDRIELERARALTQDLVQQPTTHPASQPLSASYAWGAMYVLNGSAMGASVLLKPGALPNDWPRHYLRTMQAFAKSGQLRQFFDRLDAIDLNHAESLAGATAVFDALGR